jgi:hypothetical protein
VQLCLTHFLANTQPGDFQGNGRAVACGKASNPPCMKGIIGKFSMPRIFDFANTGKTAKAEAEASNA